MNKLLSLLYSALLICICFEEMFSRTWLPFKYLKYLIVPFIILNVIKKCRGRIGLPSLELSTKLFILITTFSVFYSIPDFVSLDWDGFDVVKKYCFVPLLIICFYNAGLFGVQLNNLVGKIPRIMSVYAVLNVFLYFVRIPIWSGFQRFYWGRITVGYPTIDVVNYAIALAVLFLDLSENKSFWEKGICSLILITGVILQTSGTGLFILSLVLVMGLVCAFTKKNVNLKWARSLRKVFLFLIIASLILPSVGYGILKNYNPLLLENMTLQMENRVNLLFGDESKSTLEMNTMKIRREQMKRAENLYLSSSLSMVVGTGFGPLSYNSNRKNSYNRVFIESQLDLVRFTSGYLGLVSFFLMSASILINSRKNKRNLLLCLTGLTCIYVSYFTACAFMSFGLSGVFAILYVYKDWHIQNKKMVIK